MKSISALVDRHRNIQPPDEAIRKEVVAVLKEIISFTPALKAISVRHGVVYVDADHIVKSELFIKKTEILAILKARLGRATPKDIR